eukprot:2227519-Rhodomonas_salina.1
MVLLNAFVLIRLSAKGTSCWSFRETRRRWRISTTSLTGSTTCATVNKMALKRTGDDCTDSVFNHCNIHRQVERMNVAYPPYGYYP